MTFEEWLEAELEAPEFRQAWEASQEQAQRRLLIAEALRLLRGGFAFSQADTELAWERVGQAYRLLEELERRLGREREEG